MKEYTAEQFADLLKKIDDLENQHPEKIFDSVLIDLGRQKLYFAALPIGALEHMEEELVLFGTYPTSKQAKITGDLAYFSLRINYPNITREMVSILVTFKNFLTIIPQICAVSGMVSVENNNEEESEEKK